MRVVLLLIPLILGSICFGQHCEALATDAYKYYNRTKTICGIVSGIRTSQNPKGDTIFLAMGGAYPNNKLTAIIFGSDASKYEKYINKNIAITGKISAFRGKAHIVVEKPSKIKIVDIKKN